MGSQQFVHMAKKLRSLPSLLWDADESDGVELHRAWSSACKVTSCSCQATVAAQADTIRSLEKDKQELLEMNKSLRKKLNCSGTLVSLPKVPRLTARRVSTTNGNSAWSFLKALPQSLIDLPRMREVCQALEQSQFASGHVSFDICGTQLGSGILDHCEVCISSLWSKHPAVFKIGITRNPVERWSYYAKDKFDKWSGMKVLVALADAISVGIVEAAMIQRFENAPGARNVQRGGEGVDFSGAGPFFVYVVFRCLVPPGRSP